MNIQILKKFLSLTVYNNSRKSILNTYLNNFSFIITCFSTVFIVLILSVNDGFKITVKNVLSDLNGSHRISSKLSKQLTENDVNFIYSQFPENTSISKISSKDLIVKSKNFSEPINIIAFENTSEFIPKIEDFMFSGSFSDDKIIIGKILADKLNADIGSVLTFIDLESSNIKNVEMFTVGGIFKSNIPSYDTFRVYGSRNIFKIFLNNNYDYLLLNHNIQKDSLKGNYLLKNIADMNNEFFTWLNVYDTPIKMLVLFIMIICIFNILQNNFSYISYYKDNFYILKTLGLKNIYIYLIVILRSLFTLLASVSLGFIISYLILYFEKSYNFIILPDYVYFTSSIPININFMLPLYIFPILIFIMILISAYFYNFFVRKYEF